MLRGYVPAGFKHAYTVPVPELKDSRVKSMSYDDLKGIAISPIISKVSEHCILDRFKRYFLSFDA